MTVKTPRDFAEQLWNCGDGLTDEFMRKASELITQRDEAIHTSLQRENVVLRQLLTRATVDALGDNWRSDAREALTPPTAI